MDTYDLLSKISFYSEKSAILHRKYHDNLRYYDGDPDIVQKPSYSENEFAESYTTKDAMDVVEWCLPTILSVVTDEDTISINATTERDVKAEEYLKRAVTYFLRRKNDYFTICNDTLRDGLIYGLCVAKYMWKRDDIVEEREYRGITDVEQFQAGLPDNAVVESIDPDPEDDYNSYIAKVKFITPNEYPFIEPIPPEEVIFDPSVKDFNAIPFLAHRILLHPHEIAEKYGWDKWKEIQELHNMYMKARESTGTIENIRLKRLIDIIGWDNIYDKDNQLYVIYECYYKKPQGNKFVDWVTILCGDVVLFDGENAYGRPPFIIAPLIKREHRLVGVALVDLVKDLQELRTFLTRQILVNLFKTNYRRWFYLRGTIDETAFQQPEANQLIPFVIPIEGTVDKVIFPEPVPPLPREVLSVYELLNVEKDYHTGVPRAFTGVNPKVLNRTFAGQAQQIQQAGLRMQLIAKTYSELFLKPLHEAVVDMLLKFLSRPISIRYFDEFIEINPDNIKGDFDVTVNVGLSNTRELSIMYLQQLLQLIASIPPDTGIVTPQNLYNLIKQLIKTMGYKNADEFITNPANTPQGQQPVQIPQQPVREQQPPPPESPQPPFDLNVMRPK